MHPTKIAHYELLASRITGQQTLDGIAVLIKEMMEAKAGYRCNGTEPGPTLMSVSVPDNHEGEVDL
jgi:hypothetical protein